MNCARLTARFQLKGNLDQGLEKRSIVADVVAEVINDDEADNSELLK